MARITIADLLRWLKDLWSDGTIEFRKSRRGTFMGLHGGPPQAGTVYECDSLGECGWGQGMAMDFAQNYKPGDASKLNISNGHVRLIGADVSSGGVPTCIETAVTGLTEQSISSDIAAFVEITCAPGSNPSVNGTVQTVALASWQKYAVTSSGTLTIRHRLGYSTSGVWYREHVGEVQYPVTLYQPNITATNTRGGALSNVSNAFQYLSANGYYTLAIDEDQCVDINGNALTGDDAGSNFMEGERLGVLVLGGGVAKVYEKSNMKWGGTDADVAVDRPSMPTFPADNQFKFAAFTDTRTAVSGLLQANKVKAKTSADVVLTTDGLWVKLDSALKQLQHIHLGSSTTYDWFTCYVASTSGGAVDKEVIVDTNGHVRKYNNGTPTQTYKWKCQQCDYPTTVIYRTSDPGAFFSIAGTCYQRIGQVITATAVNTDTIDATYASCAECAAAVVNYNWLVCGTAAACAVFAPGTQPTRNFAFVLKAGKWEKSYYNAMTGVAATSPVPLICESGSPTQCSDLTGTAANICLLTCAGADGQTSFPDSALGGNAPHTTTAAGDAQVETGTNDPYGQQYGYALFDGSDSIAITPQADFNLGSTWTIRFWFKSTATGRAQEAVGDSASTAFRFSLNNTLDGVNWNAAVIIVGATDAVAWGTENQYNDGNWHYVHVKSSGGSWTCHVDGSQVASGSNGTIDASAKTLVLGSYNGSVNFLKGGVCDFNIRTDALSASTPTSRICP
jgi:hypothetical protein